LELLNNVLIYERKKDINKQPQLKEIIDKYIKYLREEVVSQNETVPLGDYSHPSRVYCTVLSVAIVMDLSNLEEFTDWPTA
jgi:hypothetical protein